MDRSLKDVLLRHYCWTITNTRPASCEYDLSLRWALDLCDGPGAVTAYNWARVAASLPWSMLHRASNAAADVFGGGILDIRRSKRSGEILVEIFEPKRVVWRLQGSIRRNVFCLETVRVSTLDKKGSP